MKAQAAVEFLIIFTATILMLSVLSSALIAQHEKMKETANDLERINAVKRAARTVEVWLNAGRITGLDFYQENISFRIEGDRFLVTHRGNVIEIEGVFEYEKAEPL